MLLLLLTLLDCIFRCFDCCCFWIFWLVVIFCVCGWICCADAVGGAAAFSL